MRIEIAFEELASFFDLLRRPRLPEILMAKTAYEQGLAALTKHEPEFAVFLLGPIGHPSVTHIVPDTTGEGTPVSFRVGAKRLNEVLRQFVPLGLEGKGFWHTHPPGQHRLSNGDLDFVGRLFANSKNDSQEILMPIMSSGRVSPFIVRRDRLEKPQAAELTIF